jgi:hypothetical protein
MLNCRSLVHQRTKTRCKSVSAMLEQFINLTRDLSLQFDFKFMLMHVLEACHIRLTNPLVFVAAATQIGVCSIPRANKSCMHMVVDPGSEVP